VAVVASLAGSAALAGAATLADPAAHTAAAAATGATRAAAVPGATPAAADVLAGATVSGSAIPCATQNGVRVCDADLSSSGGPDTRIKSFDGTPLAGYVVLPAKPPAHGGYPLVVQGHGWGSPTQGPADTQYFGPTGYQWAESAYAVLELTARGFGDSCGSAASRAADPQGCAHGFIHLDDDRYEVRDVQYVIGLLVDRGLVNPGKIGVTGESYGGGLSMALATLKNRVMLPSGKLIPWRSPRGRPLSIAAAAPMIPWTDLAYSLVPNGRTLDYRITSTTADLKPIGDMKQSFVGGLLGVGEATGDVATTGPLQWSLAEAYARLNRGEPYSGATDRTFVNEIAHYHSSYYLLAGAYGMRSEAPAPLLIANGFTDDLFPVDEAIRYDNYERAHYPADPIGLIDFDGGHMRGQNKPAELRYISRRIKAFFDHYVKGSGRRAPTLGATAFTETCPKSTPAGGPYHAASWAALHPGQVSFSAAGPRTVISGDGSTAIASIIDPVSSPGACATAPAANQGTGVASYRLPAATGRGYTLLGAPTITAKLTARGTYPMLVERLWDVDPTTGTETLVDRGDYRLTGAGTTTATFQLHPGAWHFAAGHVPKLELLSQDPSYLRTSNGAFTITVDDLRLQLPVHDRPGAPGVPKTVKPFVTPGSHGLVG